MHNENTKQTIGLSWFVTILPLYLTTSVKFYLQIIAFAPHLFALHMYECSAYCPLGSRTNAYRTETHCLRESHVSVLL